MLNVCIATFDVRSWAGTIDPFLIRWTAGETGFHSILFARFNPGGDLNRDPAGTVVESIGIPNLWHLEEAIQSMWLLLHYLENSTPREKKIYRLGQNKYNDCENNRSIAQRKQW